MRSGIRHQAGDLERSVHHSRSDRRLGQSLPLLDDVGDVDEEQVIADAEKFLGSWTGAGPAQNPGKPPPMPASSRFVLVNRPGATNALILVGLRFPDHHTSMTPAARVLAAQISGRLNNRLRESLGVTYGYGAQVTMGNRGAALVCQGLWRTAALPWPSRPWWTT